MQMTGEKNLSLRERFEARVLPEPNSGCWLWEGAASGRVELRPYLQHDGERDLAYRISHELFIGPIPDGLNVLHHCDTPLCVNPEHIYAGTQKQNMDDAVKRGRHVGQRHPDLLTSLGKQIGALSKGRFKLPPEKIAEIVEKLDRGETIKSLAAEYGVGRALIRRHRNSTTPANA